MALTDFFRINLPYGIAKNEEGDWMAFNREYRPLGYNRFSDKEIPGRGYGDLPIYSRYKNMSDKILESLGSFETAVHRNDKNEIVKVFFYNDGTNPVNQTKDDSKLWDEYFEKLKILSKLKVQ